jgi:hypothetical protein
VRLTSTAAAASDESLLKAIADGDRAAESPLRSVLLRVESGSLGNSRMDSLEL